MNKFIAWLFRKPSYSDLWEIKEYYLEDNLYLKQRVIDLEKENNYYKKVFYRAF